MYRVQLDIDLIKTCKKYPQADKIAICKAIEQLGRNPRPAAAIKLSGREGYRLRVGNYRIIYLIHDKELLVIVIDIDSRKDVYKKK